MGWVGMVELGLEQWIAKIIIKYNRIDLNRAELYFSCGSSQINSPVENGPPALACGCFNERSMPVTGDGRYCQTALLLTIDRHANTRV